jgi:hypothetical protein
MVAELKQNNKSLYDTDYNLWVLETVKKLKDRNYDSIDWENLIEEVLDLSKRDKKKVQSLLIKLFEHLLKLKCWQSEYQYNKAHWEAEILNLRQLINIELEDSPSLKPYLQSIFKDCYHKGKAIASKRLQLPLNSFPDNPIGNLEQILDEDWLP